jgi:predicted  nucleic acid-binding Zn-ribbon protein
MSIPAEQLPLAMKVGEHEAKINEHENKLSEVESYQNRISQLETELADVKESMRQLLDFLAEEENEEPGEGEEVTGEPEAKQEEEMTEIEGAKELVEEAPKEPEKKKTSWDI